MSARAEPADSEDSAVRELVKSKRLELDWSQQHLAAVTGFSVSAISSLEQGRRSPTTKVLHAVARALGTDTDELRRFARDWASASSDDERRAILGRFGPRRTSTDPVAPIPGGEIPQAAAAIHRAPPQQAAHAMAWVDRLVPRLLGRELPPVELVDWVLGLIGSESFQSLEPGQAERLVEMLERYARDPDSAGPVRVATIPQGQFRHVFTGAVALDDDGRFWIDPMARAFDAGLDSEDPRAERWDDGRVILDISRLEREPDWSPRDPGRHLLRTSEPPPPADVDAAEFAEAYRSTVLEVTLAPEEIIKVSPSDPTSGDRLPEGTERVHVVTAYNPRSRVVSEGENAERNRLLSDELTEAGHSWWPAVGRSPDGSWAEASFAVIDADEPEMVRLAQRYEQNAIFRWDDEGVSIVWTLKGS